MLAPVNRNPDARTLRQFRLLMFAAMTGLAVLAWYRTIYSEAVWNGPVFIAMYGGFALWALALLVLLFSWSSEAATRSLYVGWMSATRPLGVLMFTVGLSLMFFVLLPIFALIIRWNDPMRRKLRASSTYWEPVKPCEPTPQRMARPF